MKLIKRKGRKFGGFGTNKDSAIWAMKNYAMQKGYVMINGTLDVTKNFKTVTEVSAYFIHIGKRTARKIKIVDFQNPNDETAGRFVLT